MERPAPKQVEKVHEITVLPVTVSLISELEVPHFFNLKPDTHITLQLNVKEKGGKYFPLMPSELAFHLRFCLLLKFTISIFYHESLRQIC